MSRGTRRRAGPPATRKAGPDRSSGACTFAEDPTRAAPDARLVWDARADPDALPVAAVPVDPATADRFDHQRFAQWLYVVVDPEGQEHAVISDGYHHIRIDVEEGSLAAGHPVLLRYRLSGFIDSDAEARILPLRRLAGLYRTGRFLPSLFPRERSVEKLIAVLRVADALSAGASQREIAASLFGGERISSDWRAVSDSLRSRVRRLIRKARAISGGGYRDLLGSDFGE